MKESDWQLFLWFFHVWNEVLSSTCYIFFPAFWNATGTLLQCLHSFQFNIIGCFILLKYLVLTATEKLVVKTVERSRDKRTMY